MHLQKMKHFCHIVIVGIICIVPPLATALATSPDSATPAPKGSRQATKDDLEWMKWAGIPDPKVGMLINPDDPNIGKNVAETKIWLAQHATKNANIVCLAPQFAEKLKKFMESVPGGPPTITDGYRNPNKQNALVASGASKAGPCQSYHNYGLAADFNGGGNIAWMRANSRNFGIGVIGMWDPGHFQNLEGRYGQCGACANDSGNGYLPPPTQSPTAQFANTIRQALGMQQQPVQPPIQTPPQPLAQSQSPLGAFQEPLAATTSQLITASSSIADRLEDLAFGTTTSVTSATSVPIVIDSRDVGGIRSSREDGSVPATSGIGTGITQNTFVTEDLASQNSTPRAQSTLLQVITSVRQAVSMLSEYLRPFGNTWRAEVNSEEMYLE